MTASVRMPLFLDTDLRNEGCRVFTVDVETAYLNANMKDGRRRCTQPPEWQPEADPQEVWLHPEHAGHLLVGTTSITRTPHGRLTVGWNTPDHHRNPH